MDIITASELKVADHIIKLNKSRVGLVLERNRSLISAIYNCFNRQILYVPIDPNLPNTRIQQILSDAKIDTVITHKKYIDKVKSHNIICVNANESVDFDVNVCERNIAYILFTSGSTGAPKGVEITREGLFNFIEGISDIIDFLPNKRIACFTTVSFDIFFLESVMALYKGLTVVLANEDEQRNPRLMARLIQEGMVDIIQMTPSRMLMLANYDKDLSCLLNVKEVLIGGEQFPSSLLRLLQENTRAKIYNLYGPTEATIWTTISDLTLKTQVDIGNPIRNTQIYLLDENLSDLPNGQIGEICIAGKGVAKGYVDQDDLTAMKFVYLPRKHNVRAYRTGDLGRYRPDGTLEYVGRVDNQVKVRGHRIELEEIESHLNQIPDIKQSIVVALDINDTEKKLVAFYIGDNFVDAQKIIYQLAFVLPDYMIPSIYKRVESFIQTVNGKVDRKRVLECVEIIPPRTSYEVTNKLELTDIHNRAFDIIVSNFGSADIMLDTSLHEAGIDSITFIQIVVDLESEFGFEFDDEKLFENYFPTIKTLIEYVESKVDKKS